METNGEAFLIKNAVKIVTQHTEEWVPVARAIINDTLQKRFRPITAILHEALQEVLAIQITADGSDQQSDQLQTTERILIYWKHQSARWLRGATYRQPMNEENTQHDIPNTEHITTRHRLPGAPWDQDFLIQYDQAELQNRERLNPRYRRPKTPERILQAAIPNSIDTQQRIGDAMASWLHGHGVQLAPMTHATSEPDSHMENASATYHPLTHLMTDVFGPLLLDDDHNDRPLEGMTANVDAEALPTIARSDGSKARDIGVADGFCSRCDITIETIEHLFWPRTRNRWKWLLEASQDSNTNLSIASSILHLADIAVFIKSRILLHFPLLVETCMQNMG
ncbi:hypothetical protein R1sor_024395 [Riccia sorocarpa]|uniref:Uncharacterized protein n=1 Tax=Riccia sorocarpa TaxID=122646 RepID=A0ABD3GWG1_9MARC